MKQTLIALAVSIAACTSAIAATSKVDVKKPVATRKAATKKTSAKKTPVKKTAVKRKAPVKPAPTAAQMAPDESPAQPSAVEQSQAANSAAAPEYPVLVGEFRCDGGVAQVYAQGAEYILKVPGGRRQYTMRRVPTTTGVVRLEEVSRTAYWLQSGNKSMLIDVRAGGRVVDGCRNAMQQAREDELKIRPVNLLQ